MKDVENKYFLGGIGSIIGGVGAIGSAFGLGGSDEEQATTQIVLPPYMDKAMRDSVSQIRSAADIPFQPYPYDRIAGFTEDELAAQAGIRGMGPTYDPYMQSGLGALGQLQQWGTQGPDQALIQAQLNPFISNVLDVQQAREREDFNKQVRDTMGRMGQIGSFGGSRAGFETAQLYDDYRQRQQEMEAGLLMQGYDRALAGAERGLAAAADPRLISGFQEADLQRLGALGLSGAQQRALEQAGLDFQYDEFLREEAYPRLTAGFQAQNIGPLAQIMAGGQQTGSVEEDWWSRLTGGLGTGLELLGQNSTISGFFSNEGGEQRVNYNQGTPGVGAQAYQQSWAGPQGGYGASPLSRLGFIDPSNIQTQSSFFDSLADQLDKQKEEAARKQQEEEMIARLKDEEDAEALKEALGLDIYPDWMLFPEEENLEGGFERPQQEEAESSQGLLQELISFLGDQDPISGSESSRYNSNEGGVTGYFMGGATYNPNDYGRFGRGINRTNFNDWVNTVQWAGEEGIPGQTIETVPFMSRPTSLREFRQNMAPIRREYRDWRRSQMSPKQQAMLNDPNSPKYGLQSFNRPPRIEIDPGRSIPTDPNMGAGLGGLNYQQMANKMTPADAVTPNITNQEELDRWQRVLRLRKNEGGLSELALVLGGSPYLINQEKENKGLNTLTGKGGDDSMIGAAGADTLDSSPSTETGTMPYDPNDALGALLAKQNKEYYDFEQAPELQEQNQNWIVNSKGELQYVGKARESDNFVAYEKERQDVKKQYVQELLNLTDAQGNKIYSTEKEALQAIDNVSKQNEKVDRMLWERQNAGMVEIPLGATEYEVLGATFSETLKDMGEFGTDLAKGVSKAFSPNYYPKPEQMEVYLKDPEAYQATLERLRKSNKKTDKDRANVIEAAVEFEKELQKVKEKNKKERSRDIVFGKALVEEGKVDTEEPKGLATDPQIAQAAQAEAAKRYDKRYRRTFEEEVLGETPEEGLAATETAETIASAVTPQGESLNKARDIVQSQMDKLEKEQGVSALPPVSKEISEGLAAVQKAISKISDKAKAERDLRLERYELTDAEKHLQNLLFFANIGAGRTFMKGMLSGLQAVDKFGADRRKEHMDRLKAASEAGNSTVVAESALANLSLDVEKQRTDQQYKDVLAGIEKRKLDIMQDNSLTDAAVKIATLENTAAYQNALANYYKEQISLGRGELEIKRGLMEIAGLEADTDLLKVYMDQNLTGMDADNLVKMAIEAAKNDTGTYGNPNFRQPLVNVLPKYIDLLALEFQAQNGFSPQSKQIAMSMYEKGNEVSAYEKGKPAGLRGSPGLMASNAQVVSRRRT